MKSPGGSVVERVLGKDEVAGSIPALGSESWVRFFRDSEKLVKTVPIAGSGILVLGDPA